MNTQKITSIEDIDWTQRFCFIGAGSFAVVYQIEDQPDIVIKFGEIQDEEVEAQRFFAKKGMALPVIDYKTQILPPSIEQALCTFHGKQGERRLGFENFCTCEDLYRGILMMPRAEKPDAFREDQKRGFTLAMITLCREAFGYEWDSDPSNIAAYQGHLIALDFGNRDHRFP